MTQKYRSEDKALLDVCAVKRMSQKQSDLHTTVSRHQFSHHESNEKDKSSSYHSLTYERLLGEKQIKRKKLEILPLHVIPKGIGRMCCCFSKTQRRDRSRSSKMCPVYPAIIYNL